MVASSDRDEATCLARTLSTLVAALDRWGVDVAPVLGAAELGRADLTDRERRISVAQHMAVWDAALVKTGDPALGLRVLEAFDPRTVLTDFVYIASSSATPREAFERVAPFIRVAHEAIEVDLQIEGSHTIFRAGFRGYEDDRVMCDYFIGLVIKSPPS